MHGAIIDNDMQVRYISNRFDEEPFFPETFGIFYTARFERITTLLVLT